MPGANKTIEEFDGEGVVAPRTILFLLILYLNLFYALTIADAKETDDDNDDVPRLPGGSNTDPAA
jgi:hypothetical protein